jgi:hypothetical protein
MGSIKRLIIEKVSGRIAYVVISFGEESESPHALPWRKQPGVLVLVAVSRKREYSRMWPETIGDFVSERAKSGAWRLAANSQKPAIGGHFWRCAW